MAATAHNIAQYGYAEMSLERVASDAGYTRGALYHLFANKVELTLAAAEWAFQAWRDEVGFLFAQGGNPVETLVAVARGTAAYSRRDMPRVLSRLTAEFGGVDHPVGLAIDKIVGHVLDESIRLVAAGQRSGVIPSGEPPRVLALAYLGSIDGVLNTLSGQIPFDALFAERAALGVLGLAATSETGNA